MNLTIKDALAILSARDKTRSFCVAQVEWMHRSFDGSETAITSFQISALPGYDGLPSQPFDAPTLECAMEKHDTAANQTK